MRGKEEVGEMLSQKLERFLRKHKIYYQILLQSGNALCCSSPGNREMAKTVIVRANGKPLMVVIPAKGEVDLKELKVFLNVKDIQLEKECICRELFPECEPEAIPPFGQLYKLPCVVDQSLQDAENIFFKGGSELVEVGIEGKEFFKILKGKIGSFTIKTTKMAV